MSRRITELRELAFELCERHEDGLYKTNDVFQKFAELIIDDCISIIASIGVSNEDDSSEDIAWTVQTSLELIKEKLLVN